MQRIPTIVSLFLLLFAGSGVTIVAQQSGNLAIAAEYVSAFMEGGIEEAYSMLAAEEREGITLPEFSSYIVATFPTADLLDPIRTTYPSFYAFAIDHLYELDLSAGPLAEEGQTIHVRLSTIDLLTIAFEISESYPQIRLEGTDAGVDDVYRRALFELYGASRPPTTYIEFDITIVERDGSPVVLSGLRKNFDRMRAGELSGEASNARMTGRIEYAAELYREATLLDPENDLYLDELAFVEAWIDAMRSDLTRPVAEYVAMYLTAARIEVVMTGLPVFACEVRNSGARTIRWIEARIVYLDEDDLLMEVELVRHDLRASPLRPRQTAALRFSADGAPFGWSGEHFRLELLDAGE